MRGLRRAIARQYLIARKIWIRLFPPKMSASTVAAPAPAEGLGEKVVIVSGSTRGIGRALAAAFAAAGSRVVVNGRDERETISCAESLAGPGRRVLAVAADLSTAAGARELIDRCVAHFGRIDVLINNAGVAGPADRAVWEVDGQQWDSVLAINLMAAVHCAAAASNHAIQQNQPLRIINVSSGIVGFGAARLGPYAVSKEALEGLTRAYACDREDGLISICSVQPRSVRSAMTREYFDAATYALMDEAEAVTGVFLWAASAPAGEVQGKSFSDPQFAANPAAARLMHGPLAGSSAIAIDPVTFSAGDDLQNQPGSHMHLLENALGYYPSAFEAISRELDRRNLYAYPDPKYRELKQAIAAETGLQPDQIGLGAGSSEIINRILELFTRPGDPVLVTKPTWSFFNAFLQRWKLLPVQVPMLGSMKNADLRHDLEGLLDAIDTRTRILYLVNPCNPSGSMLPAEEITSFIARIPSHVLVILDEAYIQYAEFNMRPELGGLIESCPGRLLVLRTFSKFFALSGFRVGYACGTPESIDLLSRGEMPFGISTAASKLVPAVLGDAGFRQQVYEENLRGRLQLGKGLGRLDIPYIPSQTNFILFSCPTDPGKLRDELQRQGLILPNVDQFLQNYALLAVGREEHNEQILRALAKY